MTAHPDDVPAWKVIAVTTAIFIGCGLVGLALVLFAPRPGWGREGGDWTNVAPEVREWIKSLKMPDHPTVSCCREADAYEADLGEQSADGQNYAIITGTRGNWLPVGTKLLIPPNKIQNRQGNPTDHVIVFANGSGTVYCFIPKGGF